jgi:hypothetical protein
MVVVSPQRTFQIDADVLAIHLLGTPRLAGESGWGLVRDGSGAFARAPGESISGVVDLSLVRGMSETLYRCTVICNPWVSSPGLLAAGAFSHARVLSLDGDKFVWRPEEPGRCFGFRSGVPYLEAP